MTAKDNCFLCEEGQCHLATLGTSRIYCNLFPDLDPESAKPLHLLVAPVRHYVSISGIPEQEYVDLMLAVRRVQSFFIGEGYGPSVTALRLEPSPVPHLHIHLIFSSNPLFPLRSRER